MLLCLGWLSACATGPGGKGSVGAPKETKPVAAAAKSATPEEKKAPSIRIALLLPLSGPYKEVGQALLNAATMALFDVNDSRLELRPHDDKGTPEGAAAAAEAAIGEGAQLILGPLLAPSVRTVAPIARQHKIKVVGFSSDRTVAGAGTYLLSFLPDEEIRRIISFAHEKGYDRVAAMIPETPYGDAVAKSFTAAAQANGIAVAGVRSYQPDTSKVMAPVRDLSNYDFRKQELQRERAFLNSLGKDDFAQDILRSLAGREVLGAVKFNAVLLPEGAALLRSLAPLFPYYEVDTRKVRYLGTGLWNDPSLLREPQLRGGWFAASDPIHVQGFLDKYTALFKHSAPRIATLSYDAVALVATLSRDVKKPVYSDETLQSPSGFSGIDGIFRFRADGTAERGLAVLEVQPSGFKIVSPAPASFAGPAR